MSFQAKYGPWAIVAGASEGTGRSFARAIAANGISPILIANGGPLDQVAQEIRAEYRVDCIAAPIDLASPEAFTDIVTVAGDREIGLYVNNAGADPFAVRFLDRKVSDWLDLSRINIGTMLQCCHYFGGLMRARRRGGLLIVNSGACYGGGASLAIYTAVKAFQLNFCESLWTELQPYGVDVLTIVLGKTDTPAYHRLQRIKGMPSSPDLASPDDVAAMGLARLPHGPVHNWGLDDDQAGFLPASAATRRQRVRALSAAIEAELGKADAAPAAESERTKVKATSGGAR